MKRIHALIVLPSRRLTPGFTLVEIVAVLAILAMLSAACALALSHALSAARLSTVRQEIEQADAMVRSSARQGGRRQSLIVDLDQNKLIWKQTDQQAIAMVSLSPPWKIVSIQSAGDMDGPRTSGEIELACSADGLMPTYCLCLCDSAGKNNWMIAAGLSGQCTWLDASAKDSDEIDLTENDDASTVSSLFQSLTFADLHGAADNQAPQTSGTDAH